jgi:hypothetical protein
VHKQPHELLERRRALLDVRREQSGSDLQKLLAHEAAAEERFAQPAYGVDPVGARDLLFTIHADVVRDNRAAIRPAAQHRPVETERGDDRLDVVRPELRVAIGSSGLIG